MTRNGMNHSAKVAARQSIQERLRQIDRELLFDYKTSAPAQDDRPSSADDQSSSLGGLGGTPEADRESTSGDSYFPTPASRVAGAAQSGVGRTS